MAKRENPMAVRSKNALAQSLLALMMKNNFADISITDITERSGLARQTFYTNFSKKEDILNYMLDGLFQRYAGSSGDTAVASNGFIIDYLLFWDKNKEFLSLLFRQGLGWLFQDHNRAFFTKEAKDFDAALDVDDWQLPYVKASIAGLTYELLYMWLTEDMGLGIGTLSTVADNLLSGKLFSNDSASPGLIF